jgi:hypothetical protein
VAAARRLEPSLKFGGPGCGTAGEWRGQARVSRSFALGPAALIACFSAAMSKLLQLLHYNILLQATFQAGIGSSHLLLIDCARFPVVQPLKKALDGW